MRVTGPTTEAEQATRFEQLYGREHAPMVRVARLIVGSPGEAEEIVHDAFLAVHERWDRLDEPGGYLRVCVVNRCRSVLRRRATVERTYVPADPYMVLPGEPSLVEAELARLPARQRIALVLRYYDDRSIDDVATALGCRPGAAKSLIHRAVEQLREVL